ncbi:MAG: hypothetical protein QM811_27960 [Pirellulales bacterium]
MSSGTPVTTRRVITSAVSISVSADPLFGDRPQDVAFGNDSDHPIRPRRVGDDQRADVVQHHLADHVVQGRRGPNRVQFLTFVTQNVAEQHDEVSLEKSRPVASVDFGPQPLRRETRIVIVRESNSARLKSRRSAFHSRHGERNRRAQT